MTEPVVIELPMPPSDNRYYGKPRNSKLHKYVTRSGRLFKREVKILVTNAGLGKRFGRARLAMRVDLHLERGGDIQNRLKALCDALEESLIFDNDRQIDDLRIVRGHPVSGGRCVVTLWEKN